MLMTMRMVVMRSFDDPIEDAQETLFCGWNERFENEQNDDHDRKRE